MLSLGMVGEGSANYSISNIFCQINLFFKKSINVWTMNGRAYIKYVGVEVGGTREMVDEDNSKTIKRVKFSPRDDHLSWYQECDHL